MLKLLTIALCSTIVAAQLLTCSADGAFYGPQEPFQAEPPAPPSENDWTTADSPIQVNGVVPSPDETDEADEADEADARSNEAPDTGTPAPEHTLTSAEGNLTASSTETVTSAEYDDEPETAEGDAPFSADEQVSRTAPTPPPLPPRTGAPPGASRAPAQAESDGTSAAQDPEAFSAATGAVEVHTGGALRTASQCNAFRADGVGVEPLPQACIVPGYTYMPERDRYGGDIYQAWGVNGPRDVRTFCEREHECAGFNWPWGILKEEIVTDREDDVVDLRNGSFHNTGIRGRLCAGLYIRVAGPASHPRLICPDVTASDSGDTAYGNIRKSFDTLPEDCDRNQADAVVLPSEIECTHPPWTKFSSKATEVTCMWIASPAISCTFQVTRDLACSSRKIWTFAVSILVVVAMFLLLLSVLVIKVRASDSEKTRVSDSETAQAVTEGRTGSTATESQLPAADPAVRGPAKSMHEKVSQVMTVISVIAGAIVAALQATEGCELTS